HGIPDPELLAVLPGAVADGLGARSRRPAQSAQARDHSRQLLLLRVLELEASFRAAGQRDLQLGHRSPDRSRQAQRPATGRALPGRGGEPRAARLLQILWLVLGGAERALGLAR